MKKYLTDLIIREKKLILITLGLSLVIFLIYLLSPNKTIYSSSAKIFIKNIPQYSIVSNPGGDSLVQSESGYSNPLFNFAQLLNSKNISTRVLTALNEKQSEDIERLKIKKPDKWHEYFEKLIKTKIIPSTDTLEISLKWINGDTADEVLDEVINQFRQENIEIRRAVAVRQREHLEKNLKKISDELSEVRKQIGNYTVLNNIVDVDVEKSTLVQARVELERDVEVLKSRINYFDKKYSKLASQIGFNDVPTALRSTSVGSDPYLEDLFGNLALTQHKYANLSGTFTDKYPEVIMVKNEIQTLSDIINTRKREFFQELPVARGIYDEPSQNIVAEMANAEAEKDSLRNQLQEMEKGVQNLIKKENKLPAKIAGLEVLTKQEEALKLAYNSIKSKVIEAQIKETQAVDNIFVLNQPSEPVLLLSSLFINFLGIMYFGLLVGVFAAWLKDTAFSSENAYGNIIMGDINLKKHFGNKELQESRK